MKSLPMLALAATLFALPFSDLASAADETKPAGNEKKENEKKPDIVSGEIEENVTDELSIKGSDGKPLKFTVTTAMMPLANSKGETLAKVFHTYYRAESDSPRPVVFCFNGGPGAASVWLHLGGIGPYRADIPGDGTSHAEAPFKMVENPHTLLSVADLVFVDPVTTGYSRGKDQKSEQAYHGVEEDLAGNAEFVRRFLAHHKMWNTPIFLMGESYGVFRVSALAPQLSDSHGLRTSGLMLISGLLDFQTILGSGGNDLPNAVYLPTYTRVALYHGAIESEDPAALIAESQEFAADDYLAALHAGRSLSDGKKTEIATKLHRFTGLPIDLIERADLRIDAGLFRGALLDSKALDIGRFDARVTGTDSNRVLPYASGDPSFDVVKDVFSTLVQDHLVNRLGFDADENEEYRVLTGSVQPWSYGPYKNRYADVSDRLQRSLLSNPGMNIFVAGGKYDLATPIEGIEYSLNRIQFPTAESLTIELYEGGHMMYSNPKALEKLGADLRDFVNSALKD